MKKAKIFYNPRCSKCREGLELLNECGIEAEIVEYLKEIPSENDLKSVISKLKIKPVDLVRRSEPLYKESYMSKDFSDDEWIKILSENPILIERPIVIIGNKAVIGRPPEKILDLINK